MNLEVDGIICRSGKIPFDTRKAAVAHINRISKRRGKTQDRVQYLKPYRCEICGKWHTTTHMTEFKQRKKSGARKGKKLDEKMH